jgi:hypothetical protein
MVGHIILFTDITPNVRFAAFATAQLANRAGQMTHHIVFRWQIAIQASDLAGA